MLAFAVKKRRVVNPNTFIRDIIVSEQLVRYWALGLGEPIFHNIEH